jgi:hypothetical protein
MKDNRPKIYAIVIVSELTNSVSMHFEGFRDLDDANNFSQYLMDELNIENLQIPENTTIH